MFSQTSEKLYKLIDEIQQFGSDHTRVFGGKFQGGIRLQQSPIEFAKLINFLIEDGRAGCFYLEIGSAAGGTAFLIDHFLSPKLMVLIDDESSPRCEHRPVILKHVNRIEVISDSHSQDTIEKVRMIGQKFDIIMFDGDHSYEGVKADFKNYNQFLNSNGLVLFHDICGKHEPLFEVSKFTEELISLYPEYKWICNFDEGGLGIGVYEKFI